MARTANIRDTYKILAGIPEGISLGKPICRLEDIIHIDIINRILGYELDVCGSGKRQFDGSFEHCNEV